MKMRCERCEKVFEEEELEHVSYQIGECFGIPQYETEDKCPECGCTGFEEVRECEKCGKYFGKYEVLAGLCDECREKEENKMEKKMEVLEKLSSMANDFRGLMNEYMEVFGSTSPIMSSDSYDVEKGIHIYNEPSIACFGGEWDRVSETLGGEEMKFSVGDLDVTAKKLNGILFYKIKRRKEDTE